MVGTRGKGEVTTGTNHLGFRCARDSASAAVPAIAERLDPTLAGRRDLILPDLD